MGVEYWPGALLLGGGSGLPADPLQRWIASVRLHGANVSAGMQTTVATLIAGLKTANAWDLCDEIWLMRGENVTQALVGLKTQSFGALINAPIFTPHADIVFDGISQSFLTNFTPSVRAVAMRPTDQRFGIWETTDLSTNTSSMGTVTGAQAIRMIARNGANVVAQVNTGGTSCPLITQTSVGLTVLARRGGSNNLELWKNGNLDSTTPASATNTGLPPNPLYFGSSGGSAGPANFRAAHVAFGFLGGPLAVAADEVAFYTAVNTYMGSALELMGAAPMMAARAIGDPMVILLDQAQAEQVIGRSSIDRNYALVPRELTEDPYAGKFILSDAVLTNPAHADVAEILAACPLVPVSDIPELAEAIQG